MTPENFVNQIHRLIVDKNLAIYKDLFSSTTIHHGMDPYWVRALELHATLSDDMKAVLFEIIRQTMIDTISNVFTVLDGGSQLDSHGGEFALLSGSPAKQLNGELQDRFLEMEETRRTRST